MTSHIPFDHLIDLMRTDTAEEPPAHVVARAVRLLRSTSAMREPRPSLKKRVLAALGFDSAQQPLAYGLRAGQPTARQLVFSADGRHIELRITPHGESWVVAGQVLGACTGGAVTLAGPAGTAHAELNEVCEFTLPGVIAGAYSLSVELPEVDLEMPDLELG
jgi:hypothetical protein